jgi:hypothetical protein
MSNVIPIIGLCIELNRPRDGVCPECGSMAAVIGEGAGPHAARLDCANCHRFRGWLPVLAAAALIDTVTRYGGWPDVTVQSLSPELCADAPTVTPSDDGAASSSVQNPTKGKTMKISELYPSRFLKAGDLQGRDHKVVIQVVAEEKLGDDLKPVVTYRGWTKMHALNKGVSTFVAGALGDDTEGWTGKTVMIYPTVADFQGKPFDVIRVRMPAARDAKTPVSTAMPPPADDDEPPFDV